MRWTAPPLVCREAVELVSDFLEGSLPRRERRRLERHLAACDACDAYLEQMRAVIAASGRVTADDLDPDVLEGLVTLFHQYQQES